MTNLPESYQGHSIDFYGEEVISIQDDAGVVWVPIKRLCDNIGIEYARQQKKLSKIPSFNYVHMYVVGGDQKKRKMGCLPENQIEGWLTSINPNKVRAELRAKLTLYQQESWQAIHDYWLGRRADIQLVAQPEYREVTLGSQLKEMKLVRQRTNYFLMMAKQATNQEQSMYFSNVASTLAINYWEQIRPPNVGLIQIGAPPTRELIQKLILEGWCTDKIQLRYPYFGNTANFHQQLQEWGLPLPKDNLIVDLKQKRNFLWKKNVAHLEIDDIIFEENVPRKVILDGIAEREQHLIRICEENQYNIPYTPNKRDYDRVWVQYMNSPEWKNKTNALKEEYNYTCWECGLVSPTDMRLHHLTYVRRGGELPTDFSVLCISCHGQKHPRKN